MAGKVKLDAIVPQPPQRPPGLTDTELITKSIKNFPYAMLSKSPAKVYNEHELAKSLAISTDQRYAEMHHYKNHGGTASKDGHFARLLQTNRRLQGRDENQTHNNDDVGADIRRELGRDGFSAAEQPFAKQDPINVQDRADWQHTFDRSVKGLFIDFQLTDVPSNRLNHLDRMSTWFNMHGAKQRRKARQGPSYLTADRSLPMPPGSTRDLPGTTNPTTLILRDEFLRPKRSFR